MTVCWFTGVWKAKMSIWRYVTKNEMKDRREITIAAVISLTQRSSRLNHHGVPIFGLCQEVVLLKRDSTLNCSFLCLFSFSFY